MSQGFTVECDVLSRADWDAHLAGLAAPYQQDWAYGAVMAAGGAEVRRYVVRDPAGKACGLAQLVVRPFALMARFALCTYGPVWLRPLEEGERQIALKALRRAVRLRWPRLVAFTLDDALAPKGFRRIMTGDATIRIDLTQSDEALRKALDGKWRNRLVAAEKSALKFTPSGLKPGQYQWLLDEERKQRASKGYRGLPPEMVEAWQVQKQKTAGADKRAGLRVWRADLGRDAVAAMMFLTHGASATYHIGWSSDEGRKLGAHNLILWRAMLELKSAGIRSLDLGGVNTGSGAGIARFKLGTGGELIRRSGTFV
ncbi:MAG: FemAB family protein [Ponticaulis sp.]|nr:FemAB family protein [Ponticaulis sp.]